MRLWSPEVRGHDGRKEFLGRFKRAPVAPTNLCLSHATIRPCYVYILRSDVDGSLYVGITSRLQCRLREHDAGISAATRAKRPWKLVHRESFADHAAARQREAWLKSGAGREWLRAKLQ